MDYTDRYSTKTFLQKRFKKTLIPFLVNLLNAFLGWSIEWDYSIPVLGEYLFFPIVGYLLHHYPLSKKQRAMIYLAALMGLCKLSVSDTSPLFTLLMTGANITLCTILAFVLRKIPIIKSVVP